MTKTHLVFCGISGHAKGGFNDLARVFGNRREAIEFARELLRADSDAWVQVVELETFRIVCEDGDPERTKLQRVMGLLVKMQKKRAGFGASSKGFDVHGEEVSQ